VRNHWMIAPLLAVSASAAALQVIDVADGHTVTAKVSARELTRVSMAGDGRIARVWGLGEQMSVEPDKDGGQVFIRPVAGAAAGPFSFFVRDDAGATYTVVAVPVDMPSDAIVLKAAGSARNERGAEHSFVGTLRALVRAMALGQEPYGYTATTMGREVALWAEARVVLERRYAGELAGEVYRLTNTSSEPMRVDERELGQLAADVQAIAIARHELAPNESTAVYLVRGRR